MTSLVAAGAPGVAELADPARARAWHAAQDFEAQALGALLEPLFASVDPGSAITGGGAAEETWRPLLTQEIAKQIAHGGGLGIAAPVYRQIIQSQETP